jgi:tetratricopeptide (TPR) repeat protein
LARKRVEAKGETPAARAGLARTLVSLGYVLQAEGQVKLARDRLLESTGYLDAADRHLAAVYAKLVRISKQLEDHEAALAYASRYVELDADCVPAHFNLGHCFLDLQRYDEAHRCFAKTVEMAPTFASAHYWLGDVNLRQRNYEAALKHLSRAIELGDLRKRENIWAHGGRGRTSLILGRYNEALSDLTYITELRGTEAKASSDLAWLLAAGPQPVRNPERAVTMATQAIDPPKQHEILGAAYYRLEKYAEAKTELIEATKKADEIGYPGQTLLFLAMTCCALGEHEAAHEWFAHAENWIKGNASPANVHLRDIQREAAALLEESQRTTSDRRRQSGRRVPTAK